MMGYVKKTITEVIGKTSVTTTIEFETYGDFMAYEKSLNASQVEFCQNGLQPADIEKVMMADGQEPEWIDHDGTDRCPVPCGADCEVMFGDGARERDRNPERWDWLWEGKPARDDIVKYRVFNEKEKQNE